RAVVVFLKGTHQTGSKFARTNSGAETTGSSQTSILVSQAVAQPTESTLRRHLRIVHPVLDRLDCSQVGEYVLEVAIAQTTITPPGHDRLEFSCLHIASAHGLQEKRLIIVRHACSVRCDVGACHLSPGALKRGSSSKFQARDSYSLLPWSVAPVANS